MLREPLVHFLVAGALIFVVLSGRQPDAGERRIVVDEAVVSGLVNGYVQAFRRPPTDEDLDGMIRDYVRGEAYYREALRLGLDRDDDVVKKRLRNKMLSMASAEVEAAKPSDADLQAVLDKNPGRYTEPPHYTFEQLYLGDDNPALRAAAAAQLVAMKPGAMPTLRGPTIPLPERLDDSPLLDIATQFGDDFAATLETAPVGRWSGPVVSGFGLHLIKIERRVASPKPTLMSVRQRLENDWRSAAIQKAEEDNLTALLKGYDVVIKRPR
jgi:hypothetical protein